jgi:pimeloyl-ACP methyl ester carboxylesterase
MQYGVVDPVRDTVGGKAMLRFLTFSLGVLVLSSPTLAGIQSFPSGFRMQMVQTNGTSLYDGFGDTGDIWAPVAAKLMKDHTVIVPDLRGMGLSAHPDAGYTKKNQAVDIAGVLDYLVIDRAGLVSHDIGNMLGYAFAALYPERVTRWIVIDAPLPGIGNWDSITRSPLLWHFNFRGPDVERLVAGRERIYLDRFWNELSANPKLIDEATPEHYAALYARPRPCRTRSSSSVRSRRTR